LESGGVFFEQDPKAATKRVAWGGAMVNVAPRPLHAVQRKLAPAKMPTERAF
jgi:hypothetical protein